MEYMCTYLYIKALSPAGGEGEEKHNKTEMLILFPEPFPIHSFW